jgi:hypothetical protein
VIKKPRENEEAKSPLPACENTTIMGCNAMKTNKQTFNLSQASRLEDFIFVVSCWLMHFADVHKAAMQCKL